MSLLGSGVRRVSFAAATLSLAVVPLLSSGAAAEDVSSMVPADLVAKVVAADTAEDGFSDGFSDAEAFKARVESADAAGLEALIGEIDDWDATERALYEGLGEIHDLLADGECRDAIENAMIVENIEDLIRHNLVEALRSDDPMDAQAHIEDLEAIGGYHEQEMQDEMGMSWGDMLEGWLAACGFEPAA